MSSYKSHAEVKADLDIKRCGTELDEKGRTTHRAPHLVEQEVWKMVSEHLLSRGELFRAPYPYYLDKVDQRLIRCDSITPELGRVLRDLGFLIGQKHTDLAARNLCCVGDLAPERAVHRISYTSDSATYFNVGQSKMLKVEADNITEVPIGTDDVVLIADDLGDWPTLNELKPHLDALRPRVGTACTKLLHDLPITRLLTTRWSQDSTLSAEQMHQMFITRFLFTTVASRYPLWPLGMITGEQDSGKSTGPELILAVFRGKETDAIKLPRREDALLASISTRSYLVYDNIDSTQAAEYDDILCLIATGAEVDVRVLYQTNSRATFKLRNHAMFSSRENPFSRSDVMRRMIVLEVRPFDPNDKKEKKDLVKAVLDERPALLAEYVLRAQNILRAHLANGDTKYTCVTQMSDYEAFTLRCADYEGTMDETRHLWDRYMTQYRQSITSTNPLVYGCRLWLGKGGNADRPITSTGLFSEMQAVYRDTELDFNYKAPNAFSRHIMNNQTPLKLIGFSSRRTSAGSEYVFRPSPRELTTCKAAYNDARNAVTQRAVSSLNRFAKREQPMPMDDDPEPDNLSDLETIPYNRKGILQ